MGSDMDPFPSKNSIKLQIFTITETLDIEDFEVKTNLTKKKQAHF